MAPPSRPGYTTRWRSKRSDVALGAGIQVACLAPAVLSFAKSIVYFKPTGRLGEARRAWCAMQCVRRRDQPLLCGRTPFAKIIFNAC